MKTVTRIKRNSTILIVMILICISTVPVAANPFTERPTLLETLIYPMFVVVSVDEAIIREGNTQNHAEIIRVPRDSVLMVVGSERNQAGNLWHRIYLPNPDSEYIGGEYGWVFTERVERYVPPRRTVSRINQCDVLWGLQQTCRYLKKVPKYGPAAWGLCAGTFITFRSLSRC